MNPVSRATVDAAIAKLGRKSLLIKKDSLVGVLSALEVDGQIGSIFPTEGAVVTSMGHSSPRGKYRSILS